MDGKRGKKDKNNTKETTRDTTRETTKSTTKELVKARGKEKVKEPVKVKKVNKSQKAGIVFPVGRTKRLLKKGHYAERIGDGSAIFMASVLEYLTSEIVELSGNACHDNRGKRIAPRHILLAIKKDDELNELLKGVTISQGGVLSQINPVLLPKATQARMSANAANAANANAPQQQPAHDMEVDEEDDESDDDDDDDVDDDEDDDEENEANVAPSQSY